MRALKKCVVSKFRLIVFGQARVTSLHIIMTYVNEWRHYSSSFLLTPPQSSSLLLHTPPHSSSLLLHTPPHFSSLLLHTPPPQKSGSNGLYITTYLACKAIPLVDLLLEVEVVVLSLTQLLPKLKGEKQKEKSKQNL